MPGIGQQYIRLLESANCHCAGRVQQHLFPSLWSAWIAERLECFKKLSAPVIRKDLQRLFGEFSACLWLLRAQP